MALYTPAGAAQEVLLRPFVNPCCPGRTDSIFAVICELLAGALCSISPALHSSVLQVFAFSTITL